MEKPGRPVGSKIRQNIVEILFHFKKLHGYDVSKIYNDIFPEATQRVIYYNLKKGVSTGEFRVMHVGKEKGKYSWGDEAEKTYYALGEKAEPTMSVLVKEYYEKKKGEAIKES